MQRWLLYETVTGRGFQDLSVLSGSWTQLLNSPETFDVQVPAYDVDMARLDLRTLIKYGSISLGWFVGDRCYAAGPLYSADYTRDTQVLSLSGAGLLSHFNKRTIVPTAALTQPLIDPATGEPNPVTNTNLTGLSYGTIAKKWMQQAMSHPGGDLPIVFPSDIGGPYERNTLGSDLKYVGDEIDAIQRVENGPDIELSPRYTSDRLGIEHVYRAGTNSQPDLANDGPTAPVWDVSAPAATVKNFQIAVDASGIVTRAWAQGGRSADKVLYSRRENNLVSLGYPLMESVDTSHSSVEIQSTLDGYAAENARVNKRPYETWSFEARTDAAPLLGEYRVGDYCYVSITGDPYIRDGRYKRRIHKMSGDHEGQWVKITTGPVLAEA